MTLLQLWDVDLTDTELALITQGRQLSASIQLQKRFPATPWQVLDYIVQSQPVPVRYIPGRNPNPAR